MNEPLMLFLKKLAKNYNKIHSDWAYSKPEVIESVVSDTGRVLVAFVVVGLSLDEQPGKPLRVWVGGYVVQCLVNVVCVLLEYRKRRQRRWRTVSFRSSWLSSLGSDVAKHLGSANTKFSFVWWLLGFHWVYDAGRQLIGASPRLYWLCIGFLACDVFFVVLFIACACVVIAVCSFLTCIAFLYVEAVVEQEDASEEENERLAKYKFQRDDKMYSDGEMYGAGVVMTDYEPENHSERYLTSEDADNDGPVEFEFEGEFDMVDPQSNNPAVASSSEPRVNVMPTKVPNPTTTKKSGSSSINPSKKKQKTQKKIRKT